MDIKIVRKIKKLSSDDLKYYNEQTNVKRKTICNTKILITSDQDLDGIHIGALLMGFFERFLPEYKTSLGRLNTPVKVVFKEGKPVRWTYNLDENMKIDKGEKIKYLKGLGSLTSEIMEAVLNKDGLDKMIVDYDFDDLNIMKDFLSVEEADKRKEYIRNHKFSIASL